MAFLFRYVQEHHLQSEGGSESRTERVSGIPLKNFEKPIDMLRYFEKSLDRH